MNDENLTDPEAVSVPEMAATDATATDETPTAVPEAMVRELRNELAKRRVRSKEQTAAANSRLLAAYALADGRLIESDSVTMTDDFIGDDGLIDPAKVTAAIDSIVTNRPHLSRRKPIAPIVQGVQPQAVETQGLFTLIRDRI